MHAFDLAPELLRDSDRHQGQQPGPQRGLQVPGGQQRRRGSLPASG